jgi:hypothetical protein
MKISSKTKKVILILFAIGAMVGAWAVWYVFFKPHRNVGSETATFIMKATELANAFATDTSASAKYIDKAILLEGVISTVDTNRIAINHVICNLAEGARKDAAGLQAGQTVKVQGRLTTYNDLMEEILLDQCVIKK